ncbi:MAG TPA: ParB/RepB/Spo0J family partition protein [Candidatus Pelagibacter bacterium]|jgi:ParB family chromosome partitioning protein|nr:ParB/RepB/Spo0J family partition protein [Candidatus Pelagibacter bacterium]|tara:strand:- start:120 stop:971 length:852 start_codon:yes stop_codon:yes gene_type:complete
MINPFKPKKGLGRGLSSLIGDSEVKDSNSTISISSIVRSKYQPRKKFEKESLEELTGSIKERGIIQPIIVRKFDDQDDKFEIVAGERRWQAAQNAGLHEVPAVIIKADNLKSLEFAIVENVQRKDLNPIEEAEGYKRLIDDFQYDQEKVAKFIGKSRSHITNCLRLLMLPQKIIQHIIDEKISQGHAKILVGLDNAQLLAEKIISKKLSVRQTEALAKITKGNKSVIKRNKDSNILDIENQLTEKIGMKVHVNNKKNNSGTLTFEYKGSDQMERLIQVIKNNY